MLSNTIKHGKRNMPNYDDLLNTAESAEVVKTSPEFLHKNRAQGRGPRYVRIGRKVFYRRRDLHEWLESRVVETADTRVVV